MPILDDASIHVPLCRYCGEPPENHIEGHCLFRPTTYQFMTKDQLRLLFYAWLKLPKDAMHLRLGGKWWFEEQVSMVLLTNPFETRSGELEREITYQAKNGLCKVFYVTKELVNAVITDG